MQLSTYPAVPPSFRRRRPAFLGRFARDDGGSTIIEFAVVAAPFFFMLFGIISVGLYYFIVFSLEHAVESAARVIRTGQAQTQSPNPMTISEFKTLVCNNLPQFMPCNSTDKIRINVQNFSGYGSISPPTCLDTGGNLIASTDQVYNPGGSGAIVLVSVCYEWELSASLASIPYWISPSGAKMNNGSSLIQASTTFTTEPYN